MIILKFWSLNSDKSTYTMSALFQSVPTKCILDFSEAYLYVGLSNGDIYRILIKNLVENN